MLKRTTEEKEIIVAENQDTERNKEILGHMRNTMSFTVVGKKLFGKINNNSVYLVKITNNKKMMMKHSTSI